MNDCLFCKIFNKEVPAEIVYEKNNIMAFKDISPMAKEHYLFIYKEHTININEMVTTNAGSIIEIYQAIDSFTKTFKLSKGYRVVVNTGDHGGQSVFHTHFHVLGGEKLKGFGK